MVRRSGDRSWDFLWKAPFLGLGSGLHMQTQPRLALLLSTLLQVTPWFQGGGTATVQNGSQIAIAILRWVVGGSAVSGVFHAVSGASITLTNPAGGAVRTTNGVDAAFRVSMTYTEGSKVSTPVLYVASNLPPGLAQPSKSGTIWRITGRPTQSGVFSNVKLTGYENSNKTGHSATVTLSITVVDEIPVITAQPVNTTVTAGQPAILSVTATGTSLTYQWLKGDLEIPNATTALLTFPATKESDAGTYRVRIGNSGGSVVSGPSILTVTPAAAGPKFTSTPTNVVIHVGEPVRLNATATGTGPFTWSWTRAGQVLKTFTAPDGDGSLSIPSASASDSGLYTVSVTASGVTASAPAVQVAIVPPLQLAPPTLAGGQMTFEFQAIPQRPYLVEESLPESPSLWTPVSPDSSAKAGGDPTAEVPLRISIPDPQEGSRLYRVRAR